MSFLNNISAIFRPVQQVTQQPAPPMSQQNPGAGQGAPAAGTSQPNSEPPAPPPNPLDEFKPLWQTDPNAKPPADPLAAPILNSDPAKIKEAASKVDFLGQVPQELLQKVMQGNDPQALMQLINTVSQNTLAMAAQLSTATVEQGAARANQRLLDALPSKVADIQLRQMQPENPILRHEAVQPMLDLARSQLRMQNPNMPPAEVNKRAEDYILAVAKAATGSADTQSGTSRVDPSEDWDRFLTS